MNDAPFEPWWAAVKEKLTAAGLEIPDEEIGILEHMDNMSVEDFVAACRPK